MAVERTMMIAALPGTVEECFTAARMADGYPGVYERLPAAASRPRSPGVASAMR